MSTDTYLTDSARTASGEFLADHRGQHTLAELLKELHYTGEALNEVKRAMFYGRGYDNVVDMFSVPLIPVGQQNLPSDFVHSIMGMATEVSEISEQLLAALEGKPVNRNNLAEEAGDILWYMAMLLRYLGTDFPTVMAMNIEKLKARYPDKFDADLAINRNLVKEEETFRLET